MDPDEMHEPDDKVYEGECAECGKGTEGPLCDGELFCQTCHPEACMCNATPCKCTRADWIAELDAAVAREANLAVRARRAEAALALASERADRVSASADATIHALTLDRDAAWARCEALASRLRAEGFTQVDGYPLSWDDVPAEPADDQGAQGDDFPPFADWAQQRTGHIRREA